MSDLRITKGNTFRTILEVKAYRYDNTEIKDFDLTDCIDMRIKCRIDGVIRDITQFRVIGPNQIEILWEKGKPGAYTIEMTGKYKQQNWRYYSKNPIFKIVDTTEDQNIPEDAILKNGTYYIQGSRIYLLASNPSEIKIDKTTGHWMVGGEDTGFTARGEKGEKGDKGDPGEGVGDYTQLKNLPNLARVALTGDYSDLDNRPTIPTIPTRISQLINDAGFVTNSNIVKNYYNKTQVDEISNGILQNLAVVQVDDLDYLTECGLYRIDETTEQTSGSGQRFVRTVTTTPRLIAVVNQSTWRQNFTRNDVLQYDLRNRTFRETVLNPYSEGDIISEDSWSDWMPMDDFAVKRLSENNGDVIEDLVEPGIYRMDYTERAGQFDDKMSYFVIVDNSFDQDTRTTRQLRINSEGIQLYERTDEVELDEDGEINVLEEGEWDSIELYQQVLVSGQNIKTINGQSILGSGNITVTAEAAYVQEQADWNQTDSTAVDYIKNKPDLNQFAPLQYVSDLEDGMRDWHKLRNVYQHGEVSHNLWDDISVCNLAVNHFYWYEDCTQATFVLPWPSDDADNPYNDKTFDIYLWVTFDATAGDDAYIKFLASPDYGNPGITYDTTSEKLNFNPSYYNLMHIYWMDTRWFIHNTVVQYQSGYQEVHVGSNYGCIQLSKQNNIGRPEFATVAFTGVYDDLQGKPNIPNEVQQIINNSNFVTQSDLSGKVNASDLADVAFSGSYDDLINTPQQVVVPTNVGAFTNDAGYITNAALNNYYTKAQIDAALAESGNFNPELYYTKTNIDNLLSSYSTITSTNSKLSGKVDVSTFNTFRGTLKNVATSGSYSDLTGTPTKLSDFFNDAGFITKQKNSDWNAVNGVEEIKNKPDLSTYVQRTELSNYVTRDDVAFGLDTFAINTPDNNRENIIYPGWTEINEVDNAVKIQEDWVSSGEVPHVYNLIIFGSQGHTHTHYINFHKSFFSGYNRWEYRTYEFTIDFEVSDYCILTVITHSNDLVILEHTPQNTLNIIDRGNWISYTPL